MVSVYYHQMVDEYSIYLELRAEVADKEEFIAKLKKKETQLQEEKTQLKERSPSQQEQSIKETYSYHWSTV